MSNNKQSMKLYTEEQVEIAMAYVHAYHESDTRLKDEEILKKLTPIELPSDEEIWKWWQTQKFQKEQGEQEYTMLYEIDLPKILKAFVEPLIKGGNK